MAASRRNLLVRLQGNVLLVVHNLHSPTDEEWELYLEAGQRHARSIDFQLVFTKGGAPNAAQRKRAQELAESSFHAFGRPTPRTAVMTPSSTVRALVTLFNWFSPQRFMAFSPTDYPGAFDFIEVPASERTQLRSVLASMLDQLP